MRPISFDVRELVIDLCAAQLDNAALKKLVRRYTVLLEASKQRLLEMTIGEKRILYVAPWHIGTKHNRKIIGEGNPFSAVSVAADQIERELKSRYVEENFPEGKMEVQHFYQDPEIERILRKNSLGQVYHSGAPKALDAEFYTSPIVLYRPRLNEHYTTIFHIILDRVIQQLAQSEAYTNIIVYREADDFQIQTLSKGECTISFVFADEAFTTDAQVAPSENRDQLALLAEELGVSVADLCRAVPRLIRIRNPGLTVLADSWPALQAREILNSISKAAVEELSDADDESSNESLDQLKSGAEVIVDDGIIREVVQTPVASSSTELLKARYKAVHLAWCAVKDVLPGLENTYYKALGAITIDLGMALGDEFAQCDVLLSITLAPYYGRMLEAAAVDERVAKERYPDLEVVDRTRSEALRRLADSLSAFVAQTAQLEVVAEAQRSLSLRPEAGRALSDVWQDLANSDAVTGIETTLQSKIETALRQRAPETTVYVASTIYNIGQQTVLAAAAERESAAPTKFGDAFKKQAEKEAAKGVAVVALGSITALGVWFMHNWKRLADAVSPIFERLKDIWNLIF